MANRRFRIVKPGETPDGTLAWQSAGEKARRLAHWRRAVCKKHGKSRRAILVAWVLHGLFNAKTGYAFPSDPFLSSETELSLRDVQKALSDLDGSAVTRVHVVIDGKTQRHIYPLRMRGIPSTTDGTKTVHHGRETPSTTYRPQRRDRIRKSVTNLSMSPEDMRARADQWRADSAEQLPLNTDTALPSRARAPANSEATMLACSPSAAHKMLGHSSAH